MSEFTPDDKLLDTIARYVDGRLSMDEATELEARLIDDPNAMRAFSRYTAINASLAWSSRAVQSDVGEDASPAVHAEPTAASPLTSSRRFRASHHKLSISIAVAMAVVSAGLLTLHLMKIGPFVASEAAQEGDNQEVAEPEFVAKLSNWQNDVWLEDSRPLRRDPRLEVGKRLVLESGVVEITYKTGVQVVLVGPAEFTIGGKESGVGGQGSEDHNRARKSVDLANSGYLKHGRLVARVEGEDAQGFSVDTPYARVEDLGTEFGIEVKRDGTADVVVLSGEVDIIHDEGNGSAPTRVRLTQDQGAFVAVGGGITRHTTANIRFALSMRAQLNKVLPSFETALGELISIDFDVPGAATQAGEPRNVAGPTIAGQQGVWKSLAIGNGTKGMSIDTGIGTLTIGPGFLNYNSNDDDLRSDVIFLSPDQRTQQTPAAIEWSLAGLTPGAHYNIILFGQHQLDRGGAINAADFSIAGYDAGNGVGQPATLDAENDGNFYAVPADANGKITGTFAFREGETHSSWSGIQFQRVMGMDTR